MGGYHKNFVVVIVDVIVDEKNQKTRNNVHDHDHVHDHEINQWFLRRALFTYLFGLILTPIVLSI